MFWQLPNNFPQGSRGEIFKDECQTTLGITDTGYGIQKKSPIKR